MMKGCKDPIEMSNILYLIYIISYSSLLISSSGSLMNGVMTHTTRMFCIKALELFYVQSEWNENIDTLDYLSCIFYTDISCFKLLVSINFTRPGHLNTSQRGGATIEKERVVSRGGKGRRPDRRAYPCALACLIIPLYPKMN